MKLCYETKLAGFPIKLEQRGRDNFRVTYGAQVDDSLPYDRAALKLGAAIMHALACESLLDNRTRGEK